MPIPLRTLRFTRLKRLPFAVEITVAVLIKIALLLLLWHVFFSAPQTKKMKMPLPKVEQHLLGRVRFAPTTIITLFLPIEVHHAAHR